MDLINRKVIDEFTAKHADARRPLLVWVRMVMEANWQTPSDIKESYRSVDFLSGNRVVFNIKGNSYRLVVEVVYTRGVVDILRVGTHSEYNRWKLE